MLNNVSLNDRFSAIQFATPIAKQQPQKPVEKLSNAPIEISDFQQNNNNHIDSLDVPKVQSPAIFQGPVNSLVMPELKATSKSDLLQFCKANAKDFPVSISRVGGDFIITVAKADPIKVSGAMLAEAVKDGSIPASNRLFQALRVYEAALDAGLKQDAARGIYGSFCLAVEKGTDMAEAMQQAFTSVASASLVEAYATKPHGLTRDIEQLVTLVEQIKAGKTIPVAKDSSLGHLQDLYARHSPQVRALTLKPLIESLHGQLNQFQTLRNEARQTGDYTKAYDVLQGFFFDAAQCLGTSYALERQASLSEELVLKDCGAIDGKGYGTGGLAAAASMASIRHDAMVKPISNPEQQFYASFLTADLEQTTTKLLSFDHEAVGTSWKDFEDFAHNLYAKFSQSDLDHVYLNLQAHGEANGFLLYSGDSTKAEITSAAWINQTLLKAGFRPDQITIVAESCNGAAAYQGTKQGLAQDLVVDPNVTPIQIDQQDANAKKIEWIGRPRHINKDLTVMMQLIGGDATEPAFIRFGTNSLKGPKKQLDQLIPPGPLSNLEPDNKDAVNYDLLSPQEQVRNFHDLMGTRHATPADALLGSHQTLSDGAQLLKFRDMDVSDAIETTMTMEVAAKHMQKLAEETYTRVPRLMPHIQPELPLDLSSSHDVQPRIVPKIPVSGPVMAEDNPTIRQQSVTMPGHYDVEEIAQRLKAQEWPEMAKVKAISSSKLLTDTTNAIFQAKHPAMKGIDKKLQTQQKLEQSEIEQQAKTETARKWLQGSTGKAMLAITNGDMDRLHMLLLARSESARPRAYMAIDGQPFGSRGDNELNVETRDVTAHDGSNVRQVIATIRMTDVTAEELRKLGGTPPDNSDDDARYSVTLTLKPEASEHLAATAHFSLVDEDTLPDLLQKGWQSSGGILRELKNYDVTSIQVN